MSDKSIVKNGIVIIISLIISALMVYVIGGIAFERGVLHLFTKKVAALVFIILLLPVLLVLRHLFDRHHLIISTVDKGCRENLAGCYDRFKVRYNICRADICMLIISLVTGSLLRIPGYNWGVVAGFQADERKFIRGPIWMINNHTPYMDEVLYPNQFISRFAAVVILCVKKIRNISVEEYSSLWALFIFRFIVAICGVITIYIAFLIGNSFYRHLGGVFAFLVALYPYYVCLSKQVTGDVTSMMFLTLLMLFSLRYIDGRKFSYIILMTMCAAFATLEKWHGAVGIGYIGLVLAINSKGLIDFIKRGLWSVVLYLGWMLVVAPNLIANPVKAIREGFLDRAVYDGSSSITFQSFIYGLRSYAGFGFTFAIGIVGLVLLVIGAVYIILHFDKRYLILSLGLIKYMCLSMMNRSFARWGLELFFCELFIISFGIWTLLLADGKRSGWIMHCQRAAGILCTATVIVTMLSASCLTLLVSISNDKDSRLLQRQECVGRGINPYNTISQYYSGFAPSLDSEFPSVNTFAYTADEYLRVVEGNVYRLNPDIQYIALCPVVFNDDELSDSLEKHECPIISEYHVVCGDIFRNPFTYDTDRVIQSDLEIVNRNSKIIKQIISGGLIGDEIVVYDISGLSVTGDLRRDS